MSVIGRIFSDRYQLKKYLGGGMSSVYLAHDVILERDVVVKLIKTDPNNLDKSKNRFLREVQSTIKLSHPNVVSVYDVDDSDEYQILVTEMIIGPTLKTYIRDNHPLSIEAVVSLSRMILNGIGHAHEAGVIHRDIKPQNILLNESNDVKITDFGIAKAMSETRMTETNQVMGSVQYISPEQAKGQNTDERTDIYSFGIVLYEMLAGDVPFHGETPVSIALKQISEEMPDITDVRDDVPVSLQNIIKKCTKKNVEDRYRHTDEVFEALDQYDTFEASESDDDLDDDEDDDYDAGAEVVSPVVAQSAGETEAVEDEQPRRRRGIGCLLLLIFFFLILLPLLYIGYIFFTDETRNYVDVPNIVGQTVEEATESLAEFELGIGDVEEIYHDDVPVDAIISATPEVGESVAPASTIDVVVSLGHAPSDMPDYVGEIYEDVADSIESFGFEEVVLEEEYTDEDNAGEIIEQSIDPDSEIYPEEETLTLVISQGIEMIEVENLIGYSESQAIEMLEEAGLEAEVVARMYSDNVQSGFVMIQTPEDGEIAIGETVELTISVGPEPPQQRAYSNTINIPYTYVPTEEDEDGDDDEIDDEDAEEESQLQIVRVYISDANHSIENVYEVFGITEDSYYTVNMTIMENSSGRYVITVDDEVIEDATVPY